MIADILLQQGGYDEMWRNWEIVDALTRPFFDVAGEPMVALLFFGATGAAFYLVQQRMIVPLVTLVLIGGVAMTSTPQPASRVVIIFAMLGLATVVYLLYQRALGSSRYR